MLFLRFFAALMFGLWALNSVAMVLEALRNESDYDWLMLSLGAIWLVTSVGLWLLVMRLTARR